MSEHQTAEQIEEPEIYKQNLDTVSSAVDDLLVAREAVPVEQIDGAMYISSFAGDDLAKVSITKIEYPDGRQPTRYLTTMSTFKPDDTDPKWYRPLGMASRTWEQGGETVKTTINNLDPKDPWHAERTEKADKAVCNLVKSDLDLSNVLWREMASAQQEVGETEDGEVPEAIADLAIQHSSDEIS